MAHVTDYGLALTEVAGALMVLAFLRALLLYARSLFRPAPVVALEAPPAMFRKAPSRPAGPAPVATPPSAALEPSEILPPGTPPPLLPVTSELPLSSVILATKSVHTEEAADGSRFLYWSLTRFRHHRPTSAD